MNKENQKKYKEYQKLSTQAAKLKDKHEKASDKYQAIYELRNEELRKVDDKWIPKIEKAKAIAITLGDKRPELAEKIKALRKSLIANDNPDRKELIDLILS